MLLVKLEIMKGMQPNTDRPGAQCKLFAVGTTLAHHLCRL